MIEAGTGKADITAFKKGVGMMGYGQYAQKVEAIESNLFARAYVFRDTDTGKKVVFVNAEICFITISIKSGVIKKLQKEHPEFNYDLDNVLLTAQHTHSAPGGYGHYPFYNFSIPGFVPEVYQTIVDGITDAIVKAEKALTPANVYIGSSVFEPETDVAFNRSMKAYNANPDVERLDKKDNHLAIDREMTLMRIDDLEGKPIGCINWFGVHTTTVGNNLLKICADNKGYASRFFEDHIDKGKENGDFLAAFSQGPCGDVSPNYIWIPKGKKMRGKYEDDYESAKYNGRLQFNKAKEIYEQIVKNKPINKVGIDYGLLNVDFSNVHIDSEFTNDKQGEKTGSACMGVSFFLGHPTDGRGMSSFLGYLAIFLSTLVKYYEYLKAIFMSRENRNKIFEKYKRHGKKHIMAETGEKKMFGNRNIKNLIVPSWVDKTIAIFKQHYKNGGLNGKPWTPQILPLQIIIIGNTAIAGIPAEITTIAGRRLKKTIYDILKERNVERVIISPYANSYSGYITTYEEYQVQGYEGGHTVFGEWTLAAYQTKFKELALQMLKNEPERNLDTGVSPVEFTEEELEKRSFPVNE